MPYLHTPIEALSGVGAARKTAYNRMGIYTVEDLLYHFPRAYEHRGRNLVCVLYCSANVQRNTFPCKISTIPNQYRSQENSRNRIIVMQFA